MTESQVLVTLLSSAISGLIGVFVSFYFFRRLENRKLKIETARKLFGSKYNMAGQDFQEAMNEVMFVFADCQGVIRAMQELWETLQTPQGGRSPTAPDEKLVALMKAVCKEVGVRYKNLPDAYFLRYLSVPNNALQATQQSCAPER